MSVIPITVFFSLFLAGLFTVLFLREQRRRTYAGAERDSLLPLADESPRLVPAKPAHADGCDCRGGGHPPCADCRPAAPELPSHP